MTNTLLILGLAIVMLAQGVALRPADLVPAEGRGAAVVALVVLRLVALPLIALGTGWMLGLDGPLAAGLVLAALSVPAVAAIPLAGVSGAALPLLTSMIAIGTLAGLVWWPVAGGAMLDQAGAGWVLRDVLLRAALPFAVGMWLRSRGITGGAILPILASVAIGAMTVVALVRGEGGVWVSLQASVVMAISAVLLGMLIGQALRLGAEVPTTLAYGVLMPSVALPIGLTAGLDPSLALPAAVWGIVSYIVATILIILRQRLANPQRSR